MNIENPTLGAKSAPKVGHPKPCGDLAYIAFLTGGTSHWARSKVSATRTIRALFSQINLAIHSFWLMWITPVDGLLAANRIFCGRFFFMRSLRSHCADAARIRR